MESVWVHCSPRGLAWKLYISYDAPWSPCSLTPTHSTRLILCVLASFSMARDTITQKLTANAFPTMEPFGPTWPPTRLPTQFLHITTLASSTSATLAPAESCSALQDPTPVVRSAGNALPAIQLVPPSNVPCVEASTSTKLQLDSILPNHRLAETFGDDPQASGGEDQLSERRKRKREEIEVVGIVSKRCQGERSQFSLISNLILSNLYQMSEVLSKGKFEGGSCIRRRQR